MMNINFDPSGRQSKGVFAQVLTAIVGIIALGAAFMVSLVFFAALAVVGLVFWLYFWWKTRAVRKQIREQVDEQRHGQKFEPPLPESGSGGDVIEGEAVRVADEQSRIAG